MKRKLGINLPEWFRWSDGRALTTAELKRFRWLRKRSQKRGESWRHWFERVREPIERYEAAQARIVVKQPGLITKAWRWVRGQPSGATVELR
jgi:hypothetical protein